MQLGTRWPVAGETPPRLPEPIVEAVRAVENALMNTDTMNPDTGNWRWTLTWLEGKPIVELDNGTVIRLAQDGTARVSHNRGSDD